MLRVVLTGGIATGKSYVLDRFGRHGVPCLDTDELSHGVTAAGTEATQAIAARFGDEVIDASGAVDRRKLGPIVFADPAARKELEAMVHPAVRRAVAAGLRAFELTGSFPFAVVTIPLLHETGRAEDFDKVIATVCPGAMQIERLRGRGLSEAEARQRLAAQRPADQKTVGADFVIRTDGSHEETDRQVDAIWRQLTVPNQGMSG